MPARRSDPERLARVQTAVEEYLTARTAAELSIARAEAALVEVLKAERKGLLPVSWRQIANMLGLSHQAVMDRWKDRVDPSPKNTRPLRSTRLNRTTNGA